MNVEFFLGANSGDGFYSLYDGFAHTSGDFLYLIKGGPGCGKSSFMRRLARSYEDSGFFVEYILCSGDPDSLDGIYIPALKTGFCDATAPHTMEPGYFAVDSCYVNLGQFCPRLSSEKIAELNAEYKGLYALAYSYLSAAAEIKRIKIPGLITEKDIEYAVKRARASAKRELFKAAPSSKNQGEHKRLIHSLGCRGDLLLTGTLSKLCKRIYLVDDRFGLAEYYLRELMSLADSVNAERIFCPDPLCPELPEAVIFPELKLGYIKSYAAVEPLAYRHIRLDGIIPREKQNLFKNETDMREKLISDALACAFYYLGKAKEKHDLLEAEYKPFIDFAALNDFTDSFIEKTGSGF